MSAREFSSQAAEGMCMPATERISVAAPLARSATGGTVLVLDGQTTQALACVRSLGRAGFTVDVASRVRQPLAAWSRYCADSFVLQEETPAAFGAVRAWAARRGVHTVLPLTERSCVLCAADRAAWEACGIAVGCGDGDMLAQAFDKARTLRLAARHGIAIPPTAYPESMDDCAGAGDAFGYPCVVKPRFSNAWVDGRFLPAAPVSYAANAVQLERAVAACRQGDYWPLIQAWVPGRGRGVFALCSAGEPVVWFAHERLRDVQPTGSGSSLRRAAPVDEHLRVPAERLLRALNWHGPAMVEFRVADGGVPLLIEVNGRFWGSLQLAVSAGVDFPRMWVALLHGERPVVPDGYDERVAVRWLWGDIKRFLYILRGPPTGHRGAYPSRLDAVRELFAPQPAGTRLEAWDPTDRRPAIGEWVSGLRELLTR
jgi:predicted ATP-grasp superfamily ATP-dependent carboligase